MNKQSAGWIERYSVFVAGHAKTVALVAIVLLGILISGVRYLAFNTDYKVFFSKDNPQLQVFEEMNRTFSKSDSLQFTVRNPAGAFNAETMLVVQWLTEQSWQIPHSTRVDSVTNFRRIAATDTEITLSDLIEHPEKLTTADYASLRDYARTEPELVRKVVSEDGLTTAVAVTLALPEGDPAAPFQAVVHAEKLVADLKARSPHLEVALTGSAAIATAYPRASQLDIGQMIPALLLIIVVALTLQLRSILEGVLVFAIMVSAAVASFGFAGWARILLTPPAVMAPLMILTIAIADCLHILMNVRRIRDTGASSRDSVAQALHKTFVPVVLTSVTTILGFLSLNFSASPPYRDLGNMGATGAMVALLLSLTVLPSLLTLMLRKPRPPQADKLSSWGTRMGEALGTFTVRRYAPITIVGLLLPVLSIPALTRLEINDSIIETFDASTQIRRDSEFTLRHLNGIYNLDFKIDSGKDGGVADPEYLKRLGEFTDWLRAQPEVRSVASFSDSIKSINRAFHTNDPAWYVLPADKELAAQYVLLYEFSLPYGRTLMDRLDIRKSSSRVVATLGQLDTRGIETFQQRADRWLREKNYFAPTTTSGGISAMFAHLTHHNIWAMLEGTIFALIVIFASMIFIFRTPALTFLAIIPNTLPPFIVFGLWALLYGRINTAATMVLVIAMGLIVDSTVHILYVYKNLWAQGRTSKEAAQRLVVATMGEVALPIVITTLTLMAGFIVLGQSSFGMNADLGWLVLIFFIVGAIYDLFFLPAMICFVVGRFRLAREPAGAPLITVIGSEAGEPGSV